MNNKIFIDEIEFWEKEFKSSKQTDSRIYELAFFKIFVKFELFLSHLFIYYAIGNTSDSGYIPERKLTFKDKNHLEGILKSSKSSFIDYPEKIQMLSKYIFSDDKNPFSLIFTDSKYFTYYSNMKFIRNYIAHESNESRQRYHKNVIGQTNAFLEPNEFLVKINRKQGKSNYSIYIDALKEISEILLDPTPFFNNVDNLGVDFAAATIEI